MYEDYVEVSLGLRPRSLLSERRNGPDAIGDGSVTGASAPVFVERRTHASDFPRPVMCHWGFGPGLC